MWWMTVTNMMYPRLIRKCGCRDPSRIRSTVDVVALSPLAFDGLARTPDCPRALLGLRPQPFSAGLLGVDTDRVLERIQHGDKHHWASRGQLSAGDEIANVNSTAKRISQQPLGIALVVAVVHVVEVPSRHPRMM